MQPITSRPGIRKTADAIRRLVFGLSIWLSGIDIRTTPFNLFSGSLEQAGTSEQIVDGRAEFRPPGHVGLRPTDQYDIEWTVPQRGQAQTNRFAQASLNPISKDSSALFLTDNESDTVSGRDIGVFAGPSHNIEHGDRIRVGTPARIDQAKIPIRAEALCGWKHIGVTDDRTACVLARCVHESLRCKGTNGFHSYQKRSVKKSRGDSSWRLDGSSATVAIPAIRYRFRSMSVRRKGANGLPSRLGILLNQFVASLQASSPEDVAAVQSAHPLSETVDALMPPIVRLECSFHEIASPLGESLTIIAYGERPSQGARVFGCQLCGDEKARLYRYDHTCYSGFRELRGQALCNSTQTGSDRRGSAKIHQDGRGVRGYRLVDLGRLPGNKEIGLARLRFAEQSAAGIGSGCNGHGNNLRGQTS